VNKEDSHTCLRHFHKLKCLGPL